MIKYHRNNIVFRIASADAIGKFKQIQAHSFMQLSRKELCFDESAREAVLLEYDRLSQWIFRIEKICMYAGEDKVSAQLRNAILESFHDEIAVIESVLETNTEIFSRQVFEFMRTIHGYSNHITHDFVKAEMNFRTDQMYTAVVSTISNYLQHTLIALHEFNNNCITKTETPFVCLTDFCAESDTRFVGLSKRAMFFKSAGCGSTFVLKNYSKPEYFDEAKEYLAGLGFAVEPEPELEFARV
jgi:hypothetical protein